MTESRRIDVAAEGLLFDNDGVLVDSTSAVEASWRAFAEWYGLDADDVLSRVHGRRSREVMAYYADQLPVPVNGAFDRYLQACLTDYVDVTVLPGAAELLASLPTDRWAVVTSGTAIVTRARWVAAGLDEPPVLITAEDVPAGKPDPAPYRIAAERLGLKPQTCLAVEDAPAGLESARTAGCLTVALLTTHRESDLTADFIVKDLAAVGVRFDGAHLQVTFGTDDTR